MFKQKATLGWLFVWPARRSLLGRKTLLFNEFIYTNDIQYKIC